MVSSITSLGRNGVYDWLVQRVSAVVMLAWILTLVFLVVSMEQFSFMTWTAIFAPVWMKIFTLLMVLSLCAHAWIGMWTIATDYLTARMMGASAGKIRLLFLLVCILLIFVYLVWSIQILWSV